METLLNNLYQRTPINEITIPTEIESNDLLTAIQEISQYNPFYIRSFLSSKLFKDPNIDSDEFYDFFSTLLSSKPKDVTETDLITYNVNGTLVKIRESPRLISGSGTTGLRTWEAALYLSHYLTNEYIENLQNKTILELGSGTGLVGLTLIKDNSLNYKKLIMTDGDSNLIESLSYNFIANGINLVEHENIKCQTLWWGRDEINEDVEVVVAADVTYDASVIPYLVECIDSCLKKGAKEALIAATIRNEETIKTFEEVVPERGLNWDIISRVETPSLLKQTLWYPKTSPEIRIYRVTK